MPYRITQVADLTGVPATAIRYYEDEGLIRPAERAPNGYRVYGDRDVARLRFVSRARNLDLPVADLRGLVELWDDEDCAVVADRMGDQVAQRLRETQQQVAELMALARDLHQVQARLQDGTHAGPCDDQCVCLDRAAPKSGLPMVAATPADADPVACTLAPSAMPGRVQEWQDVLAHATGREPIAGGTSVRFPLDTTLALELIQLAAAEQSCCSFFTLALRITSDTLHLDVTAPSAAEPVVAAIFGPAGQASPESDTPSDDRIHA